MRVKIIFSFIAAVLTGHMVFSQQQRLSFNGPNGNTNYYGKDAAIAYNATDNEFLVIWVGDDDSPGMIDNEYEIFGRRIDASNGNPIGNQFRITEVGGSGNSTYTIYSNLWYDLMPAVVWNNLENEYLVVWSADDNNFGLANNEYEIFGQLIRNTGSAIGSTFRISQTGGTGSGTFDSYRPDVAYNAKNNEYLVVWDGDIWTSYPPVVHDHDIRGQRLDANGNEIGANDFEITYFPPNNGLVNAEHLIARPKVVWNSTDNEYLVVCSGEVDTLSFAWHEYEVWGQLLDSAGNQIGPDDFRISDAGIDGDEDWDAGALSTYYNSVSVAYNSVNNEYLVVWRGDDDISGLVQEEDEIYGQRLDADANEIGVNDFRISSVMPDFTDSYYARSPDITYNPENNEYYIVWYANSNSYSQTNLGDEVYLQRLNGSDCSPIDKDSLISRMGPDGTSSYMADVPIICVSDTGSKVLIAWNGDDDTAPLVDNEYEVFYRMLDFSGPRYDVSLDIAEPDTMLCEGVYEINMRIINLSNVLIDTVYIDWSLNDTIQAQVMESELALSPNTDTMLIINTWFFSADGSPYTITGSVSLPSYIVETNTGNNKDTLMNIVVLSKPDAPSSILFSDSLVCPGDSVLLFPEGGDKGDGAWLWYTTGCGSTPAGNGDSLWVNPETETSFFVRAESTCDTTACEEIIIRMKELSTPPDSIASTALYLYPGDSLILTQAGGSPGFDAGWYWYKNSCGEVFLDTGSRLVINDYIASTYYLRAEGTCNITACAEISIGIQKELINVFNTFTPNGDGINDFWHISNIEKHPDHLVEVFNREGSLVYSSNNYQNEPTGAGWNGTWKGQKLPAGTYYYLIHIGKGFDLVRGYITILY